METDVRTVGFLRYYFHIKSYTSGPWRLMSRRLNFVCTTCLMKDSIRTGTHIVQTVATVFPYLCFEQNHFPCQTLKPVRPCCWDVRMDASWRSSKLLDTKEGLDGKFSLSGRMMLWQLSVRIEYHVFRTNYHVFRTDKRDPISLKNEGSKTNWIPDKKHHYIEVILLNRMKPIIN
jgi:hypothetical protein